MGAWYSHIRTGSLASYLVRELYYMVFVECPRLKKAPFKWNLFVSFGVVLYPVYALLYTQKKEEQMIHGSGVIL